MNDCFDRQKTERSSCTHAQKWIQMQEDLGRAPNTVAAYRRALEDYLAFCSRQALLPEAVKREDKTFDQTILLDEVATHPEQDFLVLVSEDSFRSIKNFLGCLMRSSGKLFLRRPNRSHCATA